MNEKLEASLPFSIMNRLVAIQERDGHVSEKALRQLSEESGVPLARLYSTASFYSFIRLKKTTPHSIYVCKSPSCYLNGSENIIQTITELTGLEPGQHNKMFSFDTTSCIGCCDKPPAMLLDGKPHDSLTREKIKELLEKCSP